MVAPVIPPIRLMEPLTDLSMITFLPASLSRVEESAPPYKSSYATLAGFILAVCNPAPVEFFMTDG